VPLPKIRKAHQVLKKEIGTPYPFATDDFVTDGSQILDKNSLYDVVTKQKVFDYISDLIVKITPDPDGLAKELFPQNADNLVVFDPNRSFGSPICLRGGVRTEIIYRTYRAEGDINAVADWYEISPEDVAGAVKFEETIRAA
jgi:uncharacterized protein (DUF433 family)